MLAKSGPNGEPMATPVRTLLQHSYLVKHTYSSYKYIDYAYTCKSAVKFILFLNFYHICYYYIFVFLEIAWKWKQEFPKICKSFTKILSQFSILILFNLNEVWVYLEQYSILTEPRNTSKMAAWI